MSDGAAPRATRNYWTMGRGNSDRAFRSARRHSRLVRLLRIVLPILIGVVVLGIVGKTYLNKLLNKALPVDVSQVIMSGSKIVMDQPRMSGFTHDARAYDLTADAAVQDLTKPDTIELKNIRANIQMQDHSSVRMTAPQGTYNSKKETLRLDRDIVITSTTGYEGRLQDADIDIRKGHVQSDRTVHIKMLQGVLTGHRMEIINSGDLVVFSHGVTMITRLHGNDDGKSAATPAASAAMASVPAASDGKPALQSVVLHRLPPPDPRRVTRAPGRPIQILQSDALTRQAPRPASGYARRQVD